MNKIQMFSLSLAAVLAGPVYAQGCSGGNDGGMDATGNQCSTLTEVAAFAAGSAIAPPTTQITKDGQRLGLGLGSAPCDSFGEDVESRFGADCQGSAGKREASGCGAVRACPAKTAKTAAGSEAFCSGGAGGGMDLNGAECGEASAAAESAVIYASARHN